MDSIGCGKVSREKGDVVKVTTREEKAASVPSAWVKQYKKYSGADAAAKDLITKKLQSLPFGFTADDVDTIIGNETWTSPCCDECTVYTDIAIQFGVGEDAFLLCQECVSEAFGKIMHKRQAPTPRT